MTTTKLAIITASLFCLFVATVIGERALNRWERNNGYPFGRMCDSVFTGFVNTCPN